MKKTNWIVAIAAIILAVILAIVYLALGFMQVDHGLDIGLAAIWIILVVALVAIVTNREKKRKCLARRFYISESALYNAELGSVDKSSAVPNASPEELVDFIGKACMSLEYCYEMANRPEGFDPNLVVESTTFEYEKGDKSSGDARRRADVIIKWAGSLLRYEADEQGNEKLVEVAQFGDKRSLAQALRGSLAQ